MGKGLGIQRGGTHVAITAGTGCLIFIDLVAYLIRLCFGLLGTPLIDISTFRFVLYISFPKREEAIALEMFTGLEQICQKRGLSIFELNMRFSNESNERWSEDFYLKQLERNKPLTKLWVCGPPVMNQQIDKLLSKHGSTKFGLASNFHYEIL